MQTGLQTDPQRAFRLMWSLFIRLCLLIQILWEQFHISIVPKAACFLYGPRNFLWFHFKWIKELNYRKAILALIFFMCELSSRSGLILCTFFDMIQHLKLFANHTHYTRIYVWYDLRIECKVTIQHHDTDLCLYFIKKILTSHRKRDLKFVWKNSERCWHAVATTFGQFIPRRRKSHNLCHTRC